jgi:hypothetical protein
MTGKYGIHKQFFRKPRKVKGRIYRYRCKRLAPTPYSILVADNCFERLGERDMPTLGNDHPLPRGTVERLAALGIDAYGPHPDFQMYVDHGLTRALGPLPMMTPPEDPFDPSEEDDTEDSEEDDTEDEAIQIAPVVIDLSAELDSEEDDAIEELPYGGMCKELWDLLRKNSEDPSTDPSDGEDMEEEAPPHPVPVRDSEDDDTEDEAQPGPIVIDLTDLTSESELSEDDSSTESKI